MRSEESIFKVRLMSAVASIDEFKNSGNQLLPFLILAQGGCEAAFHKSVNTFSLTKELQKEFKEDKWSCFRVEVLS